MIGSEFNPYDEANRYMLSCWSPLPVPIDNEEILRLLHDNMVSFLKGDSISEMTDDVYTYVRDNLRLSAALAIVQEHHYRHHKSCFKKGKKPGMNCILCRYCKPDDVQSQTNFTDDSHADISPRRLLGSSYLNAFDKVFLSLGKSNHDIRWLRPHNVEYSVKYPAKSQGPIDQQKALDELNKATSRSYRNMAKKREQHPHLTPSEIGNFRSRSLLYHLSNFMQVDATLAAYFVCTNQGPMICSHREVTLSLFPIMSLIKGGDVTVTFVQTKGNGAIASMLLTKYLSRSDRKLCLYEWLVRYGGKERLRRQKRKRSQSSLHANLLDEEAMEDTDSSSDNETDEKESVKDESDIGCPSSLHDYLVILKGFSFKPQARRKTKEQEEEYALAALLCFVAFDQPTSSCILNSCSSFVESLAKSKEKGLFKSIGVHYLQNMEELWTLKLIAQDRTKDHNKKLLADAFADSNLHETLRRNVTNDKRNEDEQEHGGYHSESSDSSDDDFSDFEDFPDFLRIFSFSKKFSFLLLTLLFP